MHAKNIFSIFEKFITVAGIIQLLVFEICHSWPSEVNSLRHIWI